MTKLIVNVATGETSERELNKTEKDQQKTDEAYLTAQDALLQKEIAAHLAAQQVILDRIGLTSDELKIILG